MWRTKDWYEQQRAHAAKNKSLIQNRAGLYLSTTAKQLPDEPREEVVKRLQKSNEARLNSAPSFATYPELRGMRELIQADWQGSRDGAELSDDLYAAWCDALHYYHRHLTLGHAEPLGCTYIYYPETEQGPALAHNLDSSPTEAFGAPGWPAVSEHLIFGNVSSGIFMDEQSPEIFPVPVYKLLSRYCTSTDDAVELLTRYKHFWGPCNAIVIDRNHNVAMVEKSACRIGVRRSPDGFGFITAMTAEEPEMKAYLADRRSASIKARNLPDDCVDAKYWQKQDQRRELMNELLEEGRKNPTVEGLRAFIQHRSSKGNVCVNADPIFEGGPTVEYTLKSEIWLLKQGKAMWWAKEGVTPSFENRKADIDYKDVLLWE